MGRGFASTRSHKNYRNWFKGDERWNPSKVTKYKMSEEELKVYREKTETKNIKRTKDQHHCR